MFRYMQKITIPTFGEGEIRNFFIYNTQKMKIF